MGSAANAYQWKGVNWHFSSDENMTLFAENPKKYAPQCGGYCAYAVSSGFTAAANPESWIIEGGKLYLMVDEDVMAAWISERDQGIAGKAEQNWRER